MLLGYFNANQNPSGRIVISIVVALYLLYYKVDLSVPPNFLFRKICQHLPFLYLTAVL